MAPSESELAELLDEMSEQIKNGEPPRLPERFRRLVEEQRGEQEQEFFSPDRDSAQPLPHERSPQRRSPSVTNTVLNSEIRASGANSIEEWREKVGFCARRAAASRNGPGQSSAETAAPEQPKVRFFTDAQMLPEYVEASVSYTHLTLPTICSV